MDKIFKTVLLLAFPASGKSEVRKYLASLPAEELKRDFHIGENLQLDDYPYVHMMRRIDEEFENSGEKRVFFPEAVKTFFDKVSWGVLIELVNQDYDDLMTRRSHTTENAAEQLLKRMDSAMIKLGRDPLFYKNGKPLVFPEKIKIILNAMEKECKDIIVDKQKQYTDTFDGKTLVIEFARGGAIGEQMPLLSGYDYCLKLLDPRILADASILYIWVTPEESRKRNAKRAAPDASGHILHHGVSVDIMRVDYSCDDIDYLLETSDKPGFVKVETAGKTFHVPLAKFDNRVDKTSFIRNAEWKPEEVETLRDGIKAATDKLIENYANVLK